MAFSGSPRNSLVEAARKRDPVAVEQPKLISPALLAKTAPGDLKHVLGGNVKANDSFSNGRLSSRPDIEPLTINQMTQALQHLIKTDKDFVGKLHRAYVDSLHDKLQQ
jgi:hypothetical protein